MQYKKSPVFTPPRFFIPAKLGLVMLALGTQLTVSNLTAYSAQDAPSAEAAAADNVSYRLFYSQLADSGDWFQTDDYGYVFQPRVAATDKSWRPYTDGYWAQTDAGWTWVSNEEFGWACYHYGRWADLIDVGWVWVPGPDWSPAYVSWRVSKDHKHIGWAPLPPEAQVTKTEGVESWVDTAYDIGPDAYSFIDTDRFGENSYRGHLIPAEQNVTLITDTENVTRVSYRTVESRAIIYNGGPDVTVVREASGHPVRELRLETRPENVEFFQRGDSRRITEVNGNNLIIATAAPDVITSTSIRISEPAHINRRLTSITVDRGYRGIRDPQQVERLRATLRSQGPPAPPQIQQRAAAAIRRDGAAVPFERQGNNPPGARKDANVPAGRNETNTPAGRNERPDSRQPATGDLRNEATPAASVSPAPERPTTGRNDPGSRRPEVSPGATPARTTGASPAPTPEGTPEKNGRERGKATSEASPTPRASTTPENTREDRPGRNVEASPTPKEKEGRESQPEKRNTPAVEASPSPRGKVDKPEKADEKADGDRTRPSGAKGNEQETPTPKKVDRSTSNAEPADSTAPRRAAERTEDKPAKPEAERGQPDRRTNGQDAARREEKPGRNDGDEKKPASAKPGVEPAQRRSLEEGSEKPAEGSGKERAEKKETPAAPADEKDKANPKH